MLDAFLKWLGPWLLQRLATILDPEAAARAAKLLARDKELDEAEKALQARDKAFHDRLVESDKVNAEWQRKTIELNDQIAETRRKFAAATEERKSLEDELKKTLADINSRPDVDRIGKPLPGTGGDRSTKVP